MSDYAAIVGRGDFRAHLVSRGTKPYWSTNGPDNSCWVSYSGDDEVAVLDYRSEAEIARIPVGDHPQRVRVGVIRKSLVDDLPGRPPSSDDGGNPPGGDEPGGHAPGPVGGGGDGPGDGSGTRTGGGGAERAAGVGAVVAGGSDGRLPFTGLTLGALALIGACLLVAGVATRRRLRR
jgi:YVTN family beta-propeller protein